MNQRDHPLYRTWASMKGRCRNPRNEAYDDYGGRGVTICERWLESFSNFVEDMGERPEGHTLDRFPDMDGNYEKSNCRWATSEEQNRNRRSCIMVTIDGLTMTQVEWAKAISKLTGMSVPAARARLQKGWPIEKILSTPINQLKSAAVKRHRRTVPGTS